ncbi:phasin [Alsobacter sp. SYSU M60028]|uniref:Phasin n=1 Tax=Alsobacter ponti TaxID=2962936 RepID=A0ABT1LCC8_9HYPH|nr:phasin [Alsobacter ponti]MCP8939145.1 phasin [Alsobacter ponti]
MAKSPVSYEIPVEMREFAEKSVEQAKKAFDGFVGAASKAVQAVETQTTSVQANTKDIASKYVSYAENNVTAAFEHAQKLVRAKDIQEIVQLQSEFMKSQMAALQEQMKEFGTVVQSSVQKAASDAQATMQKATAEVQKAAVEVQKAATEATKRK